MDITFDGTTLALVLATPDRKQDDGRLVLYDINTKQHHDIYPKNITEISVDIEE